jgi:hypothetical protein
MSRKDRRKQARQRHRDFVLTMTDGFQEYLQEGRTPVAALALIEGDMTVLIRQNPTVKTEIEQAKRAFHNELNRLLEARP